MSQPTFYSKQSETRALRALSKHTLIAFQDRHSAHSLGKSFQCLTILMLERFFPIASLHVCSCSPLPLVLGQEPNSILLGIVQCCCMFPTRSSLLEAEQGQPSQLLLTLLKFSQADGFSTATLNWLQFIMVSLAWWDVKT